jgi:APA family basic amino acid/polyamine antiporter
MGLDSPQWSSAFSVIETGTIAAVAVAFARFSGVLFPTISEEHYLLQPIHISSHYAISLSTAQLLAIGVIAFLTLSNTLGLRYGKLIQNVFTVAKTGALSALILLGILVGRNSAALHANFSHPWHTPGLDSPVGIGMVAVWGLFIAICLSQTGSLFSADSWHNIAFAAGEVKQPERNVTRAMVIGTIVVITLYILANVAYLLTLPLQAIQSAPSDRVGTATLNAIFPGIGVTRNHGFYLWDHQRANPHRGSRVLRHGATEAFLRLRRQVERSPRACLISGAARIVGRLSGAAAYL